MIEHVVSLDEAKELAKVSPDGFESVQCYWRAKPSKNNEYWNQIAPKTLTKEELKERQSEWNKWAVNLKEITHELSEHNVYVWDYEIIPAPIAEELLALLPETYQYTSCDYINDTVRFRLGKTVAGYFGDKHNHFGKRIYFNEENINLATALSKLYRWLHGQGYIKEGK